MLPNRDELKLLDDAIASTNAAPEVAAKLRPAIIKAFDAAEFTTDQIDSWLVISKEKHSDLWGTTVDPKKATLDAEHAALARIACEGKGNADARSRLARAVGVQEADKIARTFGLSGIGDFKTVGVAPLADADDAGDDDEAAKAKGDKDKPSSNPFSPKFKGTPAEAEVERVRIIKVLGTKAAARMATAAGTDLAGRPLRRIA